MVDKVERVFVDLETTGLAPDTQVPLELGILLTNRWGGVIDESSWLIWDDGWEEAIESSISLVKEMHQKSGLWEALRFFDDVTPLINVEDEACAWLADHGAMNFPMAGNNVPYDRAFLASWMPKLEDSFHYRNIDVSTLKELCRNLNPTVFAKAPAKVEKHRVIPDLYETLAEYKFYVENFLWTE
jgi:oligoribonuclease